MPDDFKDPDQTPIITNEQGGQQSKLSGRFDLLPPKAITVVAEVLDYGARRYAPNNWRLIPVEDHVNHALAHLFDYGMYQSKAKRKEALSHAACRVLFALDLL